MYVPRFNKSMKFLQLSQLSDLVKGRAHEVCQVEVLIQKMFSKHLQKIDEEVSTVNITQLQLAYRNCYSQNEQEVNEGISTQNSVKGKTSCSSTAKAWKRSLTLTDILQDNTELEYFQVSLHKH